MPPRVSFAVSSIHLKLRRGYKEDWRKGGRDCIIRQLIRLCAVWRVNAPLLAFQRCVKLYA